MNDCSLLQSNLNICTKVVYLQCCFVVTCYVCVCVSVCVRACACVLACACMLACVCVPACMLSRMWVLYLIDLMLRALFLKMFFALLVRVQAFCNTMLWFMISAQGSLL